MLMENRTKALSHRMNSWRELEIRYKSEWVRQRTGVITIAISNTIFFCCRCMNVSNLFSKLLNSFYSIQQTAKESEQLPERNVCRYFYLLLYKNGLQHQRLLNAVARKDKVKIALEWRWLPPQNNSVCATKKIFPLHSKSSTLSIYMRCRVQYAHFYFQ